MKPTLHPQYVQPSLLPGLLNIKPATYPAESIDPLKPHYQAMPVPIPRARWESDWIVDLEDDIHWLASHYHTQPGSFLYIQELHKFTSVTTVGADGGVDVVWVEYKNGGDRATTISPDRIKFFDRWLPPIGMLRDAARLVFGVEKVTVSWLNEKRTDLYWNVQLVRHPSPEQFFAEWDKK